MLFDFHRGYWLDLWLASGGTIRDAPRSIMDGYAFRQSFDLESTDKLLPLARFALLTYRHSGEWRKRERREQAELSMTRFRQERQRLFEEVRRLFGKITS